MTFSYINPKLQNFQPAKFPRSPNPKLFTILFLSNTPQLELDSEAALTRFVYSFLMYVTAIIIHVKSFWIFLFHLKP